MPAENLTEQTTVAQAQSTAQDIALLEQIAAETDFPQTGLPTLDRPYAPIPQLPKDAEYPTDDIISQAFTELTTPQPTELVGSSITIANPSLPPLPKNFANRTQNWIQKRPWLFLPVLGIFPALAIALERPTPTTGPIAIVPTSPVPSPVATTSPNSPATAQTPVPLTSTSLPSKTPAQKLPTLGPVTPSPGLTPVDLSQLTPAQKAMNARAKAMFEATNASIDAYIEMQVSIAKGASIAFASNTALILMDEQGNQKATLKASEVHTATLTESGVTIGGQNFAGGAFVEPEPGGLLYVNNRPYRGKLLLGSDGKQLHAVNYINLRHYLYSVVASEVSPSWSVEAIKAQAVAARSYALTYYFRPAGKNLFHLGSDEYYQVYSGTQKEDDRSNQAVDATAGEYVSYKGGIVESLYAASDDIVAEAFAGKGMSQLGAKNLAEQGVKYVDILANYYPTTKVGKIAKEY